jgi:divalent metal cation (Fe/Co/Zn/Cd) transporter
MAMPCLAELLDAALPEDIEDEIIRTASAISGVIDVHDLKTRRNGMSMIIDAHILVDPTISIVQAHDIATEVEEALYSKYGKETQISIHMEPAVEK